MSKAFLEKIINDTLDILNQTNRDLLSNYREHVFVVDYRSIGAEIRKQLNFAYSTGAIKYEEFRYSDKNQLNRIIDSEAKKLAVACKRGATEDKVSYEKGKSNSRISLTPGNFIFEIVCLIEDSDPLKPNFEGAIFPESVFSRMKSYYSSQLVESQEIILNALDIPQDDPRRVENLLELGHSGDTSIATQRVSKAAKFFEEKYPQIRAKGLSSRDLRNLGISIRAVKRSNKTIDRIIVKLESRSVNRSLGAADKKYVNEFRESFRKAIIRLDKTKAAWIASKGSDSRIDIEKKKVIQKFESVKPSKAIKKKKAKNSKLNLSKNTKANVTAKRKVVKTKARAAVPTTKLDLSKRKARKSKNPGESLISLKALINKKLPATLKENMVYPRLVYRTGRFANTSQVTNIIETQKGYPSIGYTYQKAPYEIFEMGRGKVPWATPDRDPRKIIELSIREIVQDIIKTRFYFRRE